MRTMEETYYMTAGCQKELLKQRYPTGKAGIVVRGMMNIFKVLKGEIATGSLSHHDINSKQTNQPGLPDIKVPLKT